MRQAMKTTALTLLFASSSERLPGRVIRRRESANGRMTRDSVRDKGPEREVSALE
jgi:hypothetical protein